MTENHDSVLIEIALEVWQRARDSGMPVQAADLFSTRPDLIPLFHQKIAVLEKFDSLIVTELDPKSPPTFRALTVSHPESKPDNRFGELLLIPGFELGVELGRGGMGVVYLARQLQLNRLVALKLVCSAKDPLALHRFLVEAKTAAAVRHPNVVEVYQYGEHLGNPFLVLEYCNGGKLSDLTRTHLSVAPRKAAELMVAIASGVGAAHSEKIVHRDLKPDNVLFTADGTPKVSDFGLAKLGMGSDLTPSDTALGTPAYMSPEQAGGRTRFVEVQSDVWALGVILYELLAGNKPFEGANNRDYIIQILAHNMKPLRQACPGVPKDLARIVEKCLQPEPHDRYANATELAADLRNWLEGRPITARSVSAIERGWKWTRRHKTASTMIALFTAILIGLPTYVVWNEAILAESKRETDQFRHSKEEAEKFAAIREAQRTLVTIRQRTVERIPGWVELNQNDTERLIQAGYLENSQLDTLREELLIAGLAYDVQPLKTWKPPVMVLPLASSPNGQYVALGEYKVQTGLPGCIALIDPKTGTEVRRLNYKTQTSLNAKGQREEKDGNNAITFSPDGHYLYATTRSGRILRYDIQAGTTEPILDFPALNCRLWALCVSTDGKLVHAADQTHVGSWDAVTGERKALQPLEQGCVTLISNPAEPELLIEQSSGMLLRRNPATLGLLGLGRPSYHDGFGLLGGFAAGQRTLLSYHRDERQLCMNDPAFLPPRHDRTFCLDPIVRLASDYTPVTRLTCHPTLPLVATVSDSDNSRSLKVWNLARREPVVRLILPAGTDIYPTWTGPNHNQLLASNGLEMHPYRLSSPVFETTTAVVPFAVQHATFGPGSCVTTLEKPQTGAHCWRLWIDDLATGRGRSELLPWPQEKNSDSPATDVQWSPDGKKVIVTMADACYRVWLANRSPFEAAFRGSGWTRCQLAADGTRWYHVQKDNYNFDAVVLHRTTDGYGELRRWPETVPRRQQLKFGISQLAAGTKRALVGGMVGELFILDENCQQVGELPTLDREEFLSSAVSANDTLAAVSTRTGHVHVIDLCSSTPEKMTLPQKHNGGATAVAISRDGTHVATGGNDNTIRLWQRVQQSDDLQFRLLASIPNLPSACRRLEFGPTADSLLVLLEDERAARIWDLKKMNDYLTKFQLGW